MGVSIEQVVRLKPDVVLIKQIMSGMNGDRIASLLLEMPHTKDIPVVMYEEGADTEHIKRFMARVTNVHKYIVKIDPESMVSAVKSALSRNPAP